MVTDKPLACNNLANEADMIPFPKEEVTPPVTKMYLVFICVQSTINTQKSPFLTLTAN